MTFAAQLKQARLAAGLTQSQVAERLGVTPQAVYFWESGKRTPPETRQLCQPDILNALRSAK